MSRESDWAVFEKACEITASAVRGTMTGQDGQQASFVADVFRSVHEALHDGRRRHAEQGLQGRLLALRRDRRVSPVRVTSRIETMPITRPSSTTGRCRKPNANIDSSASCASTSGPIVFGSFVMNSLTAWCSASKSDRRLATRHAR